MKLHYVYRRYVSHAELQKDGKSSVGIVVKGGTKYGLRPVIKTIKMGSVAYRSHCVSERDVMVSICGLDSKGMSNKDVRRLLKEADSRIELKLEYEIREACFNNTGIHRLQRMCLKLKKEHHSYGFVLRKNGPSHAGHAEYPVISSIREDGPADKEGKLKTGDRLVQIDDLDLSWLSLPEVADILRQKDEATFLVEYRVGVVDFHVQREARRVLEIDCPDTDLGLVLHSSKSKMIIAEVREASLAARCGVLHVGDVILAINDIDAALLSASKANSLLGHFKKEPGTLIFVKHMETSPRPRTETYLWRERDKPLMNSPSSSTRSTPEQDQLVPPSSNLPHFNTPDTSYKKIFARNFPQTADNCHYFNDFQIKSACLLRQIIQNMASLQHAIAISDTQESIDASDETKVINGQEPNFVKIENSKLQQLKKLSTQSKSSIDSLAMHLVKNGKMFLLPHVGNDGINSIPNASCFSNSDHGLTRDHIVQELLGNLTEIYNSNLLTRPCLDIVTAQIYHVDFDCWDCYEACMSAALITEKMLLICPLIGKNADAWFITNRLIDDLSKIKIPCEDCARPWCSVSQPGSETKDTISDSSNRVSLNLLHLGPPSNVSALSSASQIRSVSPGMIQKHSKLNVLSPAASNSGVSPSLRNAPRSNNNENSKHNTEKKHHIGLNIAEESACYRLTQNQGSKHSNQSSMAGDSRLQFPTRTPNGSPCTNAVVLPPNRDTAEHGQNDDNENYCHNVKNKTRKKRGLWQNMKKIWKSTEIISSNKDEFRTDSSKCHKSNIQKHASVPSHLDKETRSTTEGAHYCENQCITSGYINEEDNLNRKGPIGSSTNISRASSFRGSETYPNSVHGSGVASAPNTLSSIRQLNQSDSEETQTSIVQVKLMNEGKGYGLTIEYLNTTPEVIPRVPFVTSISSPGAAHKIGILLEDDRVLAINGQSTVGLTANELESLKVTAFSADIVVLTVEFDIVVRELKYGTFDIFMDKTLKTGLEFEDCKKDSPMVVKGVVKGSAAHRSGLLFPGDKILFTSLIREETFDSLKQSYGRTETVIMTVRRDFPDEVDVQELNPDLDLSRFSESSSFIRGSKIFCLHHTSIHCEAGNNAVVLDQELTLLRDPASRDFGFQFGQNQITGVVYVNDVRPGGPADCSKAIRKKDKILEVNGISLGRNQDMPALSSLFDAEEYLKLKTRRTLRYR